MNYKKIDFDTYYRKDIFNHFNNDCKCSTSITYRIDVKKLYDFSKKTDTKFYINFLYILSKVLNSNENYRMCYLYKTNELICYDKINPKHNIFHEDTKTFTVIVTEYDENYKTFYNNCFNDIEKAKQTREYGLNKIKDRNNFDASYIPWISYDSLNIELPDGYLHFPPIINWGKYKEENNELLMPISVRMNHAIADGYLISNVFLLLEKEINNINKLDE